MVLPSASLAEKLHRIVQEIQDSPTPERKSGFVLKNLDDCIQRSPLNLEGFEPFEGLNDGVCVRFEGDQVHIALSPIGNYTGIKQQHTLPRKFFDCLLDISKRYFNVELVSIADMFCWDCHEKIQALREGAKKESFKNALSIQHNLDLLEGWLSAWFSWLCFYKRVVNSEEISRDLVDEEMRYAEETSFFYGHIDLPSINTNLQILQNSFLIPLEPNLINNSATSERRLCLVVERLKRDNLRPMQDLQKKLSCLIDCLIAWSNDPNLIYQFNSFPAHLVFQLKACRFSFSSKYSSMVDSFQSAKTNIKLGCLFFENAAKIRKAVRYSDEGSIQDKLKAATFLSKEMNNSLALLQDVHIALAQYDIKSLLDLLKSLGLQNQNIEAHQIINEAKNIKYSLALEIERFETISRQTITLILSQKDSFSISAFLHFMGWLELWQKPKLSISDIPQHYPVKLKRFLAYLIILLNKMPLSTPESKNTLQTNSLDFFHRVMAKKSKFVDRTQISIIPLSFHDYPNMVNSIDELQQILHEAKDMLTAESEEFSDNDLKKLLDFLEKTDLVNAFKTAEFLISSFESFVLIQPFSLQSHIEDFLQEIRNILEQRAVGSKKSFEVSEDTLDSDKQPDILDPTSSLDVIEVDTTSLMDVKEPSSQTNSQPELTQEADDIVEEEVLSEQLYQLLIAQERERSRCKKALSASVDRKQSLSSAPSSSINSNPSPFLTGLGEIDPVLLHELREPRKMKEYLIKAGMKILREGGRHTIYTSPGKGNFALPRHPGKDLSIGVRHKLLKENFT